MIIVWTGPIVAEGAQRPLVALYGAAGAVVTPPTARGNIDYDQVGADARLGDGPQFQMAGLGPKTPGHVIVYDSQLNAIDGGPPGGGSGSVTSVALTAPAEFSVSGSPVTTTGTLALSKANQNANLVYAGPSTGSPAAPTFRSIAAADLPLASSSAFGAVKVDGTTITAASGVISAAGSSFPLTFVQEDRYTIASAGSSITCTFPHTAASSGNTLFILISCGGNNTVTLPAGWTQDFNVALTDARLILCHKASASDTSATFSSSGADGYDVLFFELLGSHALDASSTGTVAGTFTGSVVMPAITVSANSVVFCALSTLTSGGFSTMPRTASAKWNPIDPFGGNFNGSRILAGHIGTFAASAGSITPPVINLSANYFGGGGTAYASFSIL